ncbi:hypothetical protein EAI_15940 [Harpegnathos saltator]|uniref:Uncharacterized protein n=1 Tax=Harpegnathos saltator TaxID=610380 RepID=E2B8R1_HARSA|nr:hypothetical protein EAI_15940 [Harpegnathos saltator]
MLTRSSGTRSEISNRQLQQPPCAAEMMQSPNPKEAPNEVGEARSMRSGRAREEAAEALRQGNAAVDDGATSKGRRARTLLTSEHEHEHERERDERNNDDHDDDDDDDDDERDEQDEQDDDEDEEEAVEEAVVAERVVVVVAVVGDEGNVETNDEPARGGLERCSNSHIPASNRPVVRRTGWRGALKCRKQVA